MWGGYFIDICLLFELIVFWIIFYIWFWVSRLEERIGKVFKYFSFKWVIIVLGRIKMFKNI